MNLDDVFDLAVSTRRALKRASDEPEEGNAVDAINAVSAARPSNEQAEQYAVNAINAVSQSPTELPNPGAKCTVHNRFLTFAEQLHGACSWCEWAARKQ